MLHDFGMSSLLFGRNKLMSKSRQLELLEDEHVMADVRLITL